MISICRNCDAGTDLSIGFAALQIDRLTSGQGSRIVCLGLMRTPETIWLSGYNDLTGSSLTVMLYSTESFFVARVLTELMERRARILLEVISKPMIVVEILFNHNILSIQQVMTLYFLLCFLY